ncbi:MAG: DNA recombination protein RmuC [Candidatus Fimadaptatus sp.]
MSRILEVLSRPEVLLACVGALIMIMMLCAIMLRMSRRDRDHDRQLSELRQALDEQLGGVRAHTEEQLRMSDSSLRSSMEQLGDGMARALTDAERGQSGRMDEYARRVSSASQAESERRCAFDEAMSRRMDELDARMEREHADAARRMGALREDVARDTAREVSARLDAALGGLNAQLEQLSGEMARLGDAASEIKALREALDTRPQAVMSGAQLDSLLMQWLSPGRYVRRFEVGTGSGRYADFALLMPEESGQILYLPVDASFPADEYAGAFDDEARRRLGEAVTAYARRMAEELIKPGLTTDFALMLIPSEPVSARISELEDLMQSVQQAQRVIPVGPSAFWAMVRAVEGGMNALAMQRRSAEVEHLLEEVRQALGRFTHALADGTVPRAQASGALPGEAAPAPDSGTVDEDIKADEAPASEDGPLDEGDKADDGPLDEGDRADEAPAFGGGNAAAQRAAEAAPRARVYSGAAEVARAAHRDGELDIWS